MIRFDNFLRLSNLLRFIFLFISINYNRSLTFSNIKLLRLFKSTFWRIRHWWNHLIKHVGAALMITGVWKLTWSQTLIQKASFWLWMKSVINSRNIDWASLLQSGFSSLIFNIKFRPILNQQLHNFIRSRRNSNMKWCISFLLILSIYISSFFHQ